MNVKSIQNITRNGEEWVIVKIENTVHIMPFREWKWVYGQLHPERWRKEDINKKQKKHEINTTKVV